MDESKKGYNFGVNYLKNHPDTNPIVLAFICAMVDCWDKKVKEESL